MLSNYSKLIGALTGNLIAIVLVWAAVQFPSIAECSVGPEGTEACSILGFSQAQITAAVLTLLNSFFVWRAPANKP